VACCPANSHRDSAKSAVPGNVQHVQGLAAVAPIPAVLPPRELGDIAVEIPQREAVVDADIGALHTREEALDLVGVRAVLGLVGLGVVHPLQLVQPDQVVVAGVLVGDYRCAARNVVADSLPGRIAILTPIFDGTEARDDRSDYLCVMQQCPRGQLADVKARFVANSQML
jgi:hypothetical protein